MQSIKSRKLFLSPQAVRKRDAVTEIFARVKSIQQFVAAFKICFRERLVVNHFFWRFCLCVFTLQKDSYFWAINSRTPPAISTFSCSERVFCPSLSPKLWSPVFVWSNYSSLRISDSRKIVSQTRFRTIQRCLRWIREMLPGATLRVLLFWLPMTFFFFFVFFFFYCVCGCACVSNEEFTSL